MFWPAYASWCSRMWVKDHFGLLFPIISFCSFKRLHFPFEHSLSQFDIWLGSRVWALLGNEGLSRKRYKMRCLQMPFFWFMNFANKIKRIRDKTFCFDIRLELNPRIWQTIHIHGVRFNSKELWGIHTPKVPRVLLGKRATIGSLSQNLVCQFSSKIRVTQYPRVTKKEK